MSGAGPTCFGVFADRAAQAGALEYLVKSKPDWWTAAAMLG